MGGRRIHRSERAGIERPTLERMLASGATEELADLRESLRSMSSVAVSEIIMAGRVDRGLVEATNRRAEWDNRGRPHAFPRTIYGRTAGGKLPVGKIPRGLDGMAVGPAEPAGRPRTQERGRC